jgi:hypothetical protein
MDMGPLQFLDEDLEFLFGCQCKPTIHNYGNITVCDLPLAGLLPSFLLATPCSEPPYHVTSKYGNF